jgi:hypothetical protein
LTSIELKHAITIIKSASIITLNMLKKILI